MGRRFHALRRGNFPELVVERRTARASVATARPYFTLTRRASFLGRPCFVAPLVRFLVLKVVSSVR